MLMNIIKRTVDLLKRISDTGTNRRTEKNIQKIRSSGLFDEKYYLDTYPDIRAEGIDAATHYYLYGADELRNPSAKFSTKAYLTVMGNSNENPLIHCIDYMADHPGFLPPSVSASYINNLANELFGMEWAPLKTKFSAHRGTQRVNLFLNTAKNGRHHNADRAALLLAKEYCTKYSADLRIISDKPGNQAFSDLNYSSDLEADRSINVSFFATLSDMYIDICPEDIFVCTDWRNADCVLNTPDATGKIFYLVQDDDIFFCESGDAVIRIHNILENDQVIPVVCSKHFHDYLCKEEFYSTSKTCVCLDAFALSKVTALSERSLSDNGKNKLVLWCDTNNRCNMFYLGITTVNEALKHNILDPGKWSITVVCDDSVSDFKFDVNADTEILRGLKPCDCKDLISSADLILSFAYGPALPQIVADSALAGAICLTNKHAGNDELCGYSDNIVAAGTDTGAMLNGMSKAVQLAENLKLRRSNYENTANAYKHRRESLNKAVELMGKETGL